MSQMTPAPQPTPPQPPTPYAGSSNAKYCQKCGAPNDPNAAYCQQCGDVNFGQFPPGRIERPVGVTIIAILQILASLGSIGVGLFIGAILPGFGGLFGGIIIGLGVITLLIAIALFTGRNWARILNIVFAVIDLINFPIGTIIGIIFLIYLTRPRVVAYFKQARPA